MSEQVKALFEKVGHFDHLVASSGRKKDAPFLEATPEELFAPWRQKYWTYAKAARYGLLLQIASALRCNMSHDEGCSYLHTQKACSCIGKLLCMPM